MYDHRQNQQVTDPASTSTTQPQALPELQRRPYDQESRVSTDSDLDLTDFDDEDGIRDDVYDDDAEMREDQNRSTFSGVLMRRLRMLEQQQQRPLLTTDNDVDRPGELIRPPLLATADDSFSAKMRRVLKWTHSLPPSDAVSESSESSTYNYVYPSIQYTQLMMIIKFFFISIQAYVPPQPYLPPYYQYQHQ